MAEEPDAGGPSSDDEPADAPGDEESPADGGESADRDDGSVDSEVEPQVESEFTNGSNTDSGSDEEATDSGSDEEATDEEDDPEGAEHENGDPDGAHDGDSDEGEDGDGGEIGDEGENPDEGSDAPPTAEDESPASEDRARPIGAVTDASAPPSESAPGVDGNGQDGGSAGPDEDEPDSADDSSAADGRGAQVEDGDSAASVGSPSGDVAGPVPADVPADATPDAAVEEPVPGDAAEPATDAETEVEAVDTDASPAPVHESEPTASEIADGALKQPPEGPPDDEEMPLADHIEEMILRLAVVSAVAAIAAGAVFFFEPLAEDTIMFIWNSVIPHQSMKVNPAVGGTTHPGHYAEVEAVGSTNPRVYGPLELKLTELKFASLVGFILALPVFVYETYRFMRPGLYPNERRYYLAAIPTSLVLAFVGVAFSYFIILPAIFAYFVRYSERAGVLAFALRQTFDLILVLMGYMALVFQIPLFIMLAIMMGLTDRLWLESRRLYFWGGFLGVSFLFVPEPTGMAPILVALTMVGLFEGTLALLRWTGN